MRLTTLAGLVIVLTSAPIVTVGLAIPELITKSQSVRRKKKQIPHYLLALVRVRALSPPDKGSQASPRPVTSTLDVAQILPTIDFCELDIIHKPAQPEIKVSELKDAFFFLPNNRIFIDKALPESEPTFLNKIYQNQQFSPSFFVDLYQRVNRPGPSYPRGTFNFKGARISLMHTSLNIPVWRQYLADYFRKDLVEYLEFGFPIGVDPEGHTEPCLKNHSSSYMFFSYLDKFCIKEIINGGLSGPFSSVPFETFQLSPMMTAPKKPSGRRPVFDASYGSSLNDITPQDYYLEWQAEYDFPKLDSLETLILAIGPGALMWKRDLSRYFLQLPLDPVDYWRTGFVWRQNYFFFIAFMFGLRHAGWAGQAITSAIVWIHKRSGIAYDGKMFNALNYSDDLAGCELGDRALVSFQKIALLLQELGLQESQDKASPPATKMEYLGVSFDSVLLKKSIPPEKIAILRDLLHKWLKKSTCTKRCLQSLTGKLLWVARCVSHSRCFLSRLLSGLKTLCEQHHKMKISQDMKLDILWWYTYIREFNGVSFIVSPAHHTKTYAGDACKLGAGGYHDQEYWSRLFPGPMQGDKPPIHLKEFWVMIISIRLWGPTWSGQAVEIFCDNSAVVDVCLHQKPKDPELAKFLREFLLLVVKFKFLPIVKKIGTKENRVADFISRVFDLNQHLNFFKENNLGKMTIMSVPDHHFTFSAAW